MSPREESACRRCGSLNVRVDIRDDPDKPIGLKCWDCNSYTYPPKPRSAETTRDRRRSANQKWRKRWVAKLGEPVCAWCRVRESETRCIFDVDHIVPLEADGADEFENTMLLCANCHTTRHAAQRAVQHLQGRSAREYPMVEVVA